MNDEFVKIANRKDLPPPGEAGEVLCAGRMLCIANLNGTISALDNECPHHGGPLGQGMLEDGKVICPWHAWAFDVVTGQASHTAKASVPVYEVRVEGEDVLVKLA